MQNRLHRNVSLTMTAAATEKSVRFTYTNRDGVTSRRNVRPVSLRPTAKGVVLTAMDADGPKSFRLDRIFRVKVLANG